MIKKLRAWWRGAPPRTLAGYYTDGTPLYLDEIAEHFRARKPRQLWVNTDLDFPSGVYRAADPTLGKLAPILRVADLFWEREFPEGYWEVIRLRVGGYYIFEVHR